MPNPTPGTKALKRALGRFKTPRSPLRKGARQALEKLEQTHTALRECFEKRAKQAAEAAAQATSRSLAVATEIVQSNKKYLEDMRRGGAAQDFILTGEILLSAAESQYRNAATASEVAEETVAASNARENEFWKWFDQLTDIVATGLAEGRIADIATVSATGLLIVLGVAGGPMMIVLATVGSSILMAADLRARLGKWKAADTEEARLAAATALIEEATKLANAWLKTLQCRSQPQASVR